MEMVRKTFLSKVGQTDYVKDGKLYIGTNPPCVMVESEGDLADLPDIYTPGTIAFTAGYKAMWQLDSGGEWVSML